MKLIVIVPSEAHKESAGVRIRYDRLRAALSQSGIELSLIELGRFDVTRSDYDTILFSKCYDARSLILAAAAAARSKLVGVDLFDDYFSVDCDVQLLRYREWLARFLRIAHFVLCSTERLASVAHQYRKDLPVHQLNDPAGETTSERLATRLEAKLETAAKLQHISVGWFGVGDNPFFSVGLADLAAHAPRLAELRRGGFDVELTVLTNRRALTAAGLAQIAQIPVRTHVKEWSKKAEQDLLERSFLSFLPVNARPFSMAKSLNRAATALSAGCQVLSSGYPLYRALDPLIYREVDELIGDLNRGKLRFSSMSIGTFAAKMANFASVDHEARGFARFLRGLTPPRAIEPQLITLICGEASQRECHVMVTALGGLSVASPYCTAPLDFDVVFRGSMPRLDMYVSRKAVNRLRPHMRRRLERLERIGEQDFLHVASLAGESESTSRREFGAAEPVGYQLATYAHAMAAIEIRMEEAFGTTQTIISETSKLPFVASTAEKSH